jgi:hypothetical protein
MKTMTYWLNLDDGHINEDEHDLANSLVPILEQGAATVQAEILDENVQPITTVMVLRRPNENLLLVIRADRSVLVATDDIYAMRWSDG